MSPDRIKAANAALATFTERVRIERRVDGLYIHWPNLNKRTASQRPEIMKRWSSNSGGWPPWSRQFIHGGTCLQSINHMIRWIRNQPVPGLSLWRHWAGPNVALCDQTVANILEAAGWPEVAHCVLCGIELRNGHDWWSLDGISGPCCYWTTGCRQRHQSNQGDTP